MHNTKKNSNVKAQCDNLLPCLDSNGPVSPGKTETVTVSVFRSSTTPFTKWKNYKIIISTIIKSYSLSTFSCLYTKTNECVKSLTHSFFYPTKSRNHFLTSLFIFSFSFLFPFSLTQISASSPPVMEMEWVAAVSATAARIWTCYAERIPPTCFPANQRLISRRRRLILGLRSQ